MKGTGSAPGTERIQRHQHAAEVMRARSILAIAFLLWLVTGVPIDVYTYDAIGTGSLAFVLGVRIASSVFHGAVLALLYRSPLPAPRVADAAIISVFPVSALAISLIATHLGGIASPYAIVLCVGIVVLVTAAPGPWRRGAMIVAATVGMYPLVMLLGAATDGRLSAQLHDGPARTQFVVFTAVLAAGGLVVVWAGHVLWSLRRSVFESRNLGRYRLLRRIGKGGMGEVWRAEDRALRREVALKIVSPEYGRHPSAIARFEREIQATAGIAHPNVIRIHDWGVTDDGVWYYAMDLLHGVDLATLVRQTGKLPPALVAQLGAGVAGGLAEAHRRGVIHRDIKPGNLFVVAPDGEPQRLELLDFGIARVDADSELTQQGAVVGTPGFMAPEVLAGAPGGVPADIYGLAAALYFALTGSSPRDAKHVPPSALVPGVPLALDDLIVRALDAEPSRRPASADEMAAALAALPPWTASWRVDTGAASVPDDDVRERSDPAEPPTVVE